MTLKQRSHIMPSVGLTRRFFRYGAIAQLGERLHGMQEVSGSIPLISTKSRFITNSAFPIFFSALPARFLSYCIHTPRFCFVVLSQGCDGIDDTRIPHLSGQMDLRLKLIECLPEGTAGSRAGLPYQQNQCKSAARRNRHRVAEKGRPQPARHIRMPVPDRRSLQTARSPA